MPDIFDEVDEDLRAEKAQSLLRRYAGVLIGAMVLTLAATGATVWWQDRQRSAAEATAAKFLAVQKTLEAKGAPDAAALGRTRETLAGIAAAGPGGYPVLARLRLAALEWDQGQHESAVAEWRRVSDDGAAPPLLREMATLASVQHQVDTGDATALKQQLQPLLASGSHWRPMAEQVSALLDLRLGRRAEALAIMKALAVDPQAPPGVREMAGDLVLGLDEGGADAAGSHTGTHTGAEPHG